MNTYYYLHYLFNHKFKKMKKNTQNNKLAFNKAAVTELNDSAMMSIKGHGETTNEPTTFACSNCILLPKTLQTILNVN